MNDEKLTAVFEKSPFVPDEYFEREIKYGERDLAFKLWDRIVQDEWCTIKVTRTSPYSFYLSEPKDFVVPVPDRFETSVYIRKVQPYYMELKPPAKLNWKERLRVLFTGQVPFILRKK